MCHVILYHLSPNMGAQYGIITQHHVVVIFCYSILDFISTVFSVKYVYVRSRHLTKIRISGVDHA